VALTKSRRKGKEKRKGLKKTQKTQEAPPAMGWWGYLYPPRPVRPVLWTGQTGRSAASPCTQSHLTVEILSSKRSLLRDAAMLMKIRFAVLDGPRNPGRWPVLRKPQKLHAREDSRLHTVALDAVPASAF